MLKTKSRKEGQALVVTLPQAQVNHLVANRVYRVSYLADGAIVLLPQGPDPFKNLEVGIYYEEDAWDDFSPHGAELI